MDKRWSPQVLPSVCIARLVMNQLQYPIRQEIIAGETSQDQMYFQHGLHPSGVELDANALSPVASSNARVYAFFTIKRPYFPELHVNVSSHVLGKILFLVSRIHHTAESGFARSQPPRILLSFLFFRKNFQSIHL